MVLGKRNVLQLLKIFTFAKSKRKVSPTLLVECLEEILSHLVQDRSSLYSCLFVNRLFCRLTIPILWQNPFEYQNKSGSRLIRTYVSCLDDNQKKLLLDNGLKVPDLPKPFFDYPKYMQGFDFFHFSEAVEKWVEGNYWSMPPFLIRNMKFIEQLIGNMLFSRSIGLETFRYYRGFRNIIDYQYFTDIKLYTGFTHSLSKLRTFEFQAFSYRDINSFTAWSDLFENISISTKTIEHLSLFIPHKAHNNKQLCLSLSKLIRSQTNLKSLIIDELTALFIFDALTSQAQYLTFLRVTWLSKFDLLYQLLPICSKLEALEFSQVSQSESGINDSKFQITQINLKNLYCVDDNPSQTMINTILQMSNKNLSSLLLKNVTAETLNTLELHCPKITHLCLKISSKQLPKFIQLLSGLVLKHLSLENLPEEPRYATEDIKLLAQTIPLSLRYFGIKFHMSLTDFKSFCKECGASLDAMALYYIPKMDVETLISTVKYSKHIPSLKYIKFGRDVFKFYNSLLINDLEKVNKFKYTIGEAKSLNNRFYDMGIPIDMSF
ncbi:12941_t:CDS:2 [Gigaspora margarita]|uniref:12941_t:CDS:1 n=1 Tax=Gigaspora margarita TaxID=4874 RepID=A0ABN7UNS3_GIGMA|nr:12941_t:CDS:2 [Gigaspora margarita]